MLSGEDCKYATDSRMVARSSSTPASPEEVVTVSCPTGLNCMTGNNGEEEKKPGDEEDLGDNVELF